MVADMFHFLTVYKHQITLMDQQTPTRMIRTRIYGHNSGHSKVYSSVKESVNIF